MGIVSQSGYLGFHKRAEEAVALPEHVFGLGRKVELLEKMLAIHELHGTVGERPWLPEVEGEVRVWVEEIDVHPARLEVGPAAEVNLQGAAQMTSLGDCCPVALLEPEFHNGPPERLPHRKSQV